MFRLASRDGPAIRDGQATRPRFYARSSRTPVKRSPSRSVNTALVLLYRQVGHRIHADVLRQERAAYGEEIVPTPSAHIGKGIWPWSWAAKSLPDGPFCERPFPTPKIVSTLSRQLGWGHFLEPIPLESPAGPGHFRWDTWP